MRAGERDRQDRPGGIFIYGYHGFQNVGAECRMLAIVDQLRRRLPEIRITVSSFHRGHLSHVDGAEVVVFHPASYRWAARRHIGAADVLVLAEGNMLTDEFSPHMVLAFITAIEQATELGTASVGLALDSGSLSSGRVARVVEALNGTSLLTVRTPQARTVLAGMGVTRPIEVTGDCAVSLPPAPDERQVGARLGLSGGVVHGIAPVDFHMWPARVNPLGLPRDFVRWPFKATWPDGGRARTEILAAAWTSYGLWLLDRDRSAQLAMIAMDPSDRHLCQMIAGRLPAGRVRTLSGTEVDCRSMSAVIGGLSTIATSRYHALVLAMARGVPSLALGHDTRMAFLADEMGLAELHIRHDAPGLAEQLIERHAQLERCRPQVSTRMKAQHTRMQAADRRNYELVASLCEQLGHLRARPSPPEGTH
ncbi:MAG: polysaccharide pyruvyl transferase family protein [Acidimicrobiales bacterium]